MNFTTAKKGALIGLCGILIIFIIPFPCPVETILGIPCPGCGMSTALYYVLHLDFETALFFHPMVFGCILYFLLLAGCYLKDQTFDTKAVHILTTVFVVLLLITYVYRMVTIFPKYPMPYNEDSILGRIIAFF